MTADLHIHTTASDGRKTPEEVILEACKYGLSHIAITDHDTVEALLHLYKNDNILGNNTLTVIPGIEFSTDLPAYEVHILGYYINIFSTRLHKELKIITADRLKRLKNMIAKLNNLGFSITYEDVLRIAGEASAIGRPYVARALVEKGYFANVTEVFNKLIFKNGPAFVPHYKLKPEQAIELIIDAGGVPILAHPGLIGNDEIVFNMIAKGIRGIEAYHPTHSNEQTQKYIRMANDYGLAITGGSDFHGIESRFPERLGIFTVPKDLAVNLHGLVRH